jgi:photosystem II stability/assembly factor-like uncharacterized protein
VQVTAGRLFVWVRGEQMLYGSDDGGESWQALQGNVEAWTIADEDGRLLYAWRRFKHVPEANGLYRSPDGGASWQHIQLDRK